MMYKEGEKVVLKVDKPAVSERLFGRKGEIFEIYEVDPYDDYCYGLVNDRGVFFWVRAEDVEKHDPDKLTIKNPFDLYDLPYTLREIVSRIDDLAEALKTMNEKIDEMSVNTAEITFGKDFPEDSDITKGGKLTGGFDLDEIRWRPKTNNELRKELIDEAKKKVELTVERRAKHLYENISFHVNPTKRVVVCIIKEDDGEIIGKGIAKCAPEDVFNRHLGKFIALRRACGLTNYEMESKFLDPVQPDKLVKGMRITPRNQDLNSPYVHTEVVERVDDEKAWVSSYAYAPHWTKEVNDKFYISDTNAEY